MASSMSSFGVSVPMLCFSIPWDEHSSLFNYIHVLLHQDFLQAASPKKSSPYSSWRSWESNNSSRHNTIQKNSVLWLQLALLLHCLFAVLVVSAIRFARNWKYVFKRDFHAIYDHNNFSFLNSTLNPVLYCWRIKEVRPVVKDTLSCSHT